MQNDRYCINVYKYKKKMNRVLTSRGSTVNKFEFSAPINAPMEGPRYIRSTAIHIPRPPDSSPSKNRMAISQRSPRQIPFISETQQTSSPNRTIRNRSIRFAGSPSESRRGLAAAQQIREYMVHFEKLVEMTREYLKNNPTYFWYIQDVQTSLACKNKVSGKTSMKERKRNDGKV